MGSITVVSLNSSGISGPTNRGPLAAIDRFRKHARAGRVSVDDQGLQGDDDGAAAHGHRGRALLAYPSEHYAFWQTVRAQVGVAGWDAVLPWGSLGEHLTLQGLAEVDAWIGDQLRFPDCTLAISEPRSLDEVVDAALAFPQATRLMAQSGWCGFHLAVRVPGSIAAGDRGELIPGPREIGIVELFRERAQRRAGS